MNSNLLNEYSLNSLISQYGPQLASDLTHFYSNERHVDYKMGKVPRFTKFIESKLDLDNDWITFYFLTQATPKGGDTDKNTPPDKQLSMEPKFSVNSADGGRMERNPSQLYEIKLRFLNVSTCFTGESGEKVRKSRAKPKPLELKQTPIQNVEKPEYTPEVEKPEATLKNQPKSQGIAKDSGLVKPEPIKPSPKQPEPKEQKPIENLPNEEEEENPPTFHTMEARKTQAEIKDWIMNADFQLDSDSPSFYWQGFAYKLSQVNASINKVGIPDNQWNQKHGNYLLDKHLLELIVNFKFYLPQITSSLSNQWRKANTQRKESIQEQNERTQEIWMSFAKGSVRIFKMDKKDNKYFSPRMVATWKGDQIVKVDKQKQLIPIVDVKGLVNIALGNIKDQEEKITLKDSIYKACQIVIAVYSDTDFTGINKAEVITAQDPNSADVRLEVPSGEVIYANRKALMKEDISTARSLPVMWEKDKYGDGFRFNIGDEKFSAWFETESGNLQNTLMDYDEKNDEFEYEFNHDFSWKQREYAYKLLDEINDVGFSFGNDAEELDSNTTGLTGKGNVGTVFKTVIDNLIAYTERSDVPIISFQANSDSKSRPTLYTRLAKALIGKTHNYVLEIAVNKYFNLYQFFCIRKDIYSRLFDAKLSEANDAEETPKENNKKFVCTIGNFTSLTGEHANLMKKVIATANNMNADPIAFILPYNSSDVDLVSLKTKAGLIKSICPEIKICMDYDSVDNLHSAMVWAYNKGYKEAYIIVGSDQVEKCNELMEYYNDKNSTSGKFSFSKFVVSSYGKDNPDESKEAVKSRNSVIDNDLPTFIQNNTAFKGSNGNSYTLTKKLFDVLRNETSGSIGV